MNGSFIGSLAVSGALIVSVWLWPKYRWRVPLAWLVVFGVLTAMAMIADYVGAEEIASCGDSHGYGYYANRGLVPEKSAGWQKDDISGGRISLVSTPGMSFDILIKDALGLSSYLSQGVVVAPLGIDESSVSVLAFNPNAFSEVYVFQRTRANKYQVMWTQTKTGNNLFPKASAFVAECDFVDIFGASVVMVNYGKPKSVQSK